MGEIGKSDVFGEVNILSHLVGATNLALVSKGSFQQKNPECLKGMN